MFIKLSIQMGLDTSNFTMAFSQSDSLIQAYHVRIDYSKYKKSR